MAWSESTTLSEVNSLLEYLIHKNWISSIGQNHYVVTVDGHGHIADLRTNVDSSQAFVAMWFDASMTEAYEKAIKLAIKESGYEPLRIDRKPDVDKIDDEIIGEIRRSRFLVADFMHGDGGARGGVYYEAGFAYGLGLPVIRSCRKDIVDDNKLHFDVRQYYHVVWEKVEELHYGLRNRIKAVIGEGPNVPSSSS